MKRLIFLIVCFLLSINLYALQVQDLFTVECSTITPTTTADINSSNVLVKQVMISNGGTAQTVSIYKNVKTGLTPTIVAKIDVPASSVVYFPSNIATDDQNFNIPYFSVRTSTTTNSAKVNVIYKS